MNIKRIVAASLCLALICATLLLSGCELLDRDKKPEQWTSFEYFDTYTVFYDYSGDGAFDERRDKVEEILEFYNSLFDIYSSHDGVTGLY
jgi:hypothetical protein